MAKKQDPAPRAARSPRGVRQFDALPVYNLTRRSWVATIAMEDFARMGAVANEARVNPDLKTQRELDPSHAFKLAKYILRALVDAACVATEADEHSDKETLKILRAFRDELGDQPSFALQPFVVSVRKQDRPGLKTHRDGEFDILQVPTKTRLWVIDGQHRIEGIKAVSAFLDNVQTHNTYKPITIGDRYSGYLFGSTGRLRSAPEGLAWRAVQWQYDRSDVSVNLFIDLDLEQERQLFHDLNNLGRKVDAGLSFAFDQSNPINRWIKDELIPKVLDKHEIVDRDRKSWEEDTGAHARRDLVTVNAFLFLRKSGVRTAEPKHITKETCELALRFWEQVMKVRGMGKPGAKTTTILAQPVVQKALALLVNEYGMPRHTRGKVRDPVDPKTADRILGSIPKIDWSHDNKLWRVWLHTKPSDDFPGIPPYLPRDKAKARGTFASIDHDHVRFGVVHNEIAPALADLLRFELKLPPRPKGKGQPVAKGRIDGLVESREAGVAMHATPEIVP